MTDPHCAICHGLGWVCENHPDKAWTASKGGCQCGAGMPCACNRDADGVPDVEAVIVEIETDPKRLH